jgi:hypothetical protein
MFTAVVLARTLFPRVNTARAYKYAPYGYSDKPFAAKLVSTIKHEFPLRAQQPPPLGVFGSFLGNLTIEFRYAPLAGLRLRESKLSRKIQSTQQMPAMNNHSVASSQQRNQTRFWS